MIRTEIIYVFSIVVLLMSLGCAQQQSQVQKPAGTFEEVPQAIKEPVNEVGAGISGINNIEDQLNTSGLEELDGILADIEQI